MAGKMELGVKLDAQAFFDAAAPFVADIEYLANRCEMAGSYRQCKERDWGDSANSIVSIAYGLRTLDGQVMPLDLDDAAACSRAVDGLPEHRKTPDVLTALGRALDAVKGKP